MVTKEDLKDLREEMQAVYEFAYRDAQVSVYENLRRVLVGAINSRKEVEKKITDFDTIADYMNAKCVARKLTREEMLDHIVQKLSELVDRYSEEE